MIKHKVAHTRMAHKQMICDLIDEITNVFGYDLHLTFETDEQYALQFHLGKKNNKFNLLISYSYGEMQLFQSFSFQVISKNMEEKQMVISIYAKEDKSEIRKRIFIGRSEKSSKKTYLVDVGSELSSLSMAKLARKLFSPFGRKKHVKPYDNVNANFIMINMNLFLVEEEDVHIQDGCERVSKGYYNNYHNHHEQFLYERNYYSSICDPYAYAGLSFQHAVRYMGNVYVKGSIKKSKDVNGRYSFIKVPYSSKCDRWRRLVQVREEETKWVTNVSIYH